MRKLINLNWKNKQIRIKLSLGVGYCSFVKSPDDTEDWIIYHSKKTSAPGWDRNVCMQLFKWNVDGTPNFGIAVRTIQEIARPSQEAETYFQ